MIASLINKINYIVSLDILWVCAWRVGACVRACVCMTGTKQLVTNVCVCVYECLLQMCMHVCIGLPNIDNIKRVIIY